MYRIIDSLESEKMPIEAKRLSPTLSSNGLNLMKALRGQDSEDLAVLKISFRALGIFLKIFLALVPKEEEKAGPGRGMTFGMI